MTSINQLDKFWRSADLSDYVELLAFLTTSALISGLVSRVRKTAEEQKQLTQELRRRQVYLAEAQKLSHAGSFGWKVSTGEILWSEETLRIFQYAEPKP